MVLHLIWLSDFETDAIVAAVAAIAQLWVTWSHVVSKADAEAAILNASGYTGLEWIEQLNNILAVVLIAYGFCLIGFMMVGIEYMWWKYISLQMGFYSIVSVLGSTFLQSKILAWLNFGSDLQEVIRQTWTLNYAPAIMIGLIYACYRLWVALIRGPIPEIDERLDMQGKICIVTGATAGIGRETAWRLARLGATVVVPVRNVKKGSEVMHYLQKRAGKGSIHLLELDMASFDSVKKFVRDFESKFNHLDVLVSNAGVLNVQREVTVDGLEMCMQVNHYSPFLLDILLLPSFKKSVLVGGPRIVRVSSSTLRYAIYRYGRFIPEALSWNRFDNLFANYGMSKLAAWLISRELSKRLNATSKNGKYFHINSVQPGSMVSSISRDFGIFASLHPLISPLHKSLFSGANTQVFLATSPSVQGQSNQFWEKSVVVSLPENCYLDDDSKLVWELTEKRLGINAQSYIDDYLE